MNKRLIYLDQNLLGHIAKETITLKQDPQINYIYSTHHFSEISRSASPEDFLNTLEKVNASYLSLEFNSSFEYTGSAIIDSSRSPLEHFKNYQDNIKQLNIDPNLLNPLILWGNGANNFESINQLPINIKEQFSRVFSQIGLDPDITNKLSNTLFKNYEELKNIILSVESNAEKTYKILLPKGAASNAKTNNPLKYIWDHLISDEIKNEITSDQFYRFKPFPQQKDCKFYFQIIECCQILDIIGFFAEKKRRKSDSLPNVQSDANHIATALCFCDELVTADIRMEKRAAAITTYTNRRLKTDRVILK